MGRNYGTSIHSHFSEKKKKNWALLLNAQIHIGVFTRRMCQPVMYLSPRRSCKGRRDFSTQRHWQWPPSFSLCFHYLVPIAISICPVKWIYGLCYLKWWDIYNTKEMSGTMDIYCRFTRYLLLTYLKDFFLKKKYIYTSNLLTSVVMSSC